MNTNNKTGTRIFDIPMNPTLAPSRVSPNTPAVSHIRASWLIASERHPTINDINCLPLFLADTLKPAALNKPMFQMKSETALVQGRNTGKNVSDSLLFALVTKVIKKGFADTVTRKTDKNVC
jgi:hypothetical protein